MTSYSDSPLGKESAYPQGYDASLLYSIPRSDNRDQLGITADSLPFAGVDIWNAYEMSWLDLDGKPQVAIGQFAISCDAVNIIESKSFKLFLNSLNQAKFPNWTVVSELLTEELSKRAGGDVDVCLYSPAEYAGFLRVDEPGGKCLDDLPIAINHYSPNSALLVADPDLQVEESLYTHLFRSNCPVTGQPDWASIYIDYQGPQLDLCGLLAYLVSFRQHQDFHENCVERIFTDILQQAGPNQLDVQARFTRRGGLDINPFRSTRFDRPPSMFRHVRQ